MTIALTQLKNGHESIYKHAVAANLLDSASGMARIKSLLGRCKPHRLQWAVAVSIQGKTLDFGAVWAHHRDDLISDLRYNNTSGYAGTDGSFKT